MNQESSAVREESIRDMLAVFEARLTGQPGGESWRELSAMLNGAPPWRAELNRRWAHREDWKAFLQWEIDFQAEQWNRESLPVGFSKHSIRPCGNQGQERILIEFVPGVRGWFTPVEILSDEFYIIEWTQPGAGRVRGCVVRTDETNDNGEPVWAWDGTFEPVEAAS